MVAEKEIVDWGASERDDEGTQVDDERDSLSDEIG